MERPGADRDCHRGHRDLGSAAAAQTSLTLASITGRVVDASDAPLPGAAVAAVHAESNLTRTAVTDGEGRYSLPSLPVGDYRITAEFSGFKPFTRTFTLSIGQAVTIPIVLVLADVTETITVAAEAPIFKSSHGPRLRSA